MSCNDFCQPNSGLSPELASKTAKHPCYSQDAHHKFARMHLPVAPKCNISCNYCNRKFDCVNESRPGVTSEILTPEQALAKFKLVRQKVENLSVVGIAGPGDALANWENTKRSIELIRAEAPDTIFCLSTNGLMLPDYGPQVVKLGIQHVTVTVNTLDPQIGAKIYKYINYNGTQLRGGLGASVLIGNQLAGIEYLAQKGVLVKVNIVMVKGINDGHIPEVVKKVKSLGAFMTNIMPLIPAPGSVFQNYPQTSMKELNHLRDICELDLRQMRHCKQCRADAIGLLGHDRSAEFSSKSHCNPGPFKSSSVNYRIAVASGQGNLVDQHFGHASEFMIFQGNGSTFQLVERRPVDKYCTGVEECDEEEDKRDRIVDTLSDCDAVLIMRIGYHAEKRLLKKGVLSIPYCDTVSSGLIYAAQKLDEAKSGKKEAV